MPHVEVVGGPTLLTVPHVEVVGSPTLVTVPHVEVIGSPAFDFAAAGTCKRNVAYTTLATVYAAIYYP